MKENNREGDHKDKLSKLQDFLQNHANKSMFLVIVIDPSEKRVQILNRTPSRCQDTKLIQTIM